MSQLLLFAVLYKKLHSQTVVGLRSCFLRAAILLERGMKQRAPFSLKINWDKRFESLRIFVRALQGIRVPWRARSVSLRGSEQRSLIKGELQITPVVKKQFFSRK